MGVRARVVVGPAPYFLESVGNSQIGIEGMGCALENACGSQGSDSWQCRCSESTWAQYLMRQCLVVSDAGQQLLKKLAFLSSHTVQ